MQTHLKHQHCPVAIGPGQGPHAYRLVCTQHNKTVQWLSDSQARFLFGQGVLALTTITTHNNITAIKMRTSDQVSSASKPLHFVPSGPASPSWP